ncbi:phosphoserine phosphatase SerB [Oceanicella actignis]|uniref:Phosphoserine phosphatase n=1 Tax=Oceanicella actignis TaxID=1189325 RepID=A0A1M7SA94_9RHOB|nr:phosphoserine phosphatase SerB [Oceanicella actignis]TYO91554.1 phosphoserine phosphatase [Oceanicella actignis]SET29161.1 phosphoserine phosphatase [Oceanicella actignis]SHN55509.1 phosphoserine phosphatase [Oceanicella actignis]
MSHLIVLTSARGVSDAQAEAAARAAGAGAPRRLGRGGVELDLDGAMTPEARAEALARARAALADAEVDVNAVPREGRRKRVLIADMDSTIIPVECIDEIADFAGVKPRVAEITERAMRGELDFDGALRARVALLAGLPAAALDRVLAERISLNPGARTLARTMAAQGAVTALVSGGFTHFAEPVARMAGFARHQANRLRIAEGRLTGEVEEPILGRQAKLEALRALCAEIGASPAEAVAVGDGANDLAMIEAAGLGVAYRAKPAVAACADAALRWSDLSAILHLQGLGEDQFEN